MTKKSKEQRTVKSSGKMLQFCSFRVNGRLYGIEINKIKEITSEVYFTPVFHAPREVKGYVNIRGQIHLVIDLRMLLGFDGVSSDSGNCVILFKQNVGEFFGIYVDKIGDVVEIEDTKIEYHSKKENILTEPVQATMADIAVGVSKLDRELMEILNPSAVLTVIQMKVAG